LKDPDARTGDCSGRGTTKTFTDAVMREMERKQ
jgi:hypothetical protein